MLLPDKHIGFAESLIGLGSFILDDLRNAKDVDTLWKSFEKVRGNVFPAYHSFDNLVLAVDVLFAMGAIELQSNGKLMRCRGESKLCA